MPDANHGLVELPLNFGQVNLVLSLLELRRHPEDNSTPDREEDIEQLVLALPTADPDVLYTLAEELDAAAARRQHATFARFHEYQRVALHRSGEITADFLEDGLYYRPSQAVLLALLNAVDKVDSDFRVLRTIRQVQSKLKADGVDFPYDLGILPAAPAVRS